MSVQSKIAPISASERKHIRILVNELGVNEASKRLGVTPPTTCRVLAELPVATGTVAVLRHCLNGAKDTKA